MSSHKQETMKLSEQGVITGQALLAYLRNELSAEEKQEVENLLHSDPFAQDALEGLRSAANKEAVDGAVLSLHKKIHERLGIKEKKNLKIHWVNYVWIAVILGLALAVCFAIIYYLGKNTGQSGGNEKRNEQNINSAPEKLQQAAPPVIVPTDTTLNSAAGASDTVKPVAPTGNTNVNTVSSAATGTEKNIPASAPSGKLQAPVNVVKPGGASGPTGPSAATGGSGTTSPVKATSKDAMQAFNSADYKKAAEQFDEILKHEPDNADALYFGGISDYINGKNDKSEKNFDKLLKEGTSYLDGAKWYKANILFSKGDIQHSKTLLQELSNSNGSYKERAIKKLGDMGQ